MLATLCCRIFYAFGCKSECYRVKGLSCSRFILMSVQSKRLKTLVLSLILGIHADYQVSARPNDFAE